MQTNSARDLTDSTDTATVDPEDGVLRVPEERFSGRGRQPRANTLIAHPGLGNVSIRAWLMRALSALVPALQGPQRDDLALGADGDDFADPDEVARYAAYLADASRSRNGAHEESARRYAEEALKTTTVRGREYRTFAPTRRALSASTTFTPVQAVILVATALGIGLGLALHGVAALEMLVAIITIVYLGTLLLDAAIETLAFVRPSEAQISDELVHALADADWPTYTILCPLYREAEVVPQFAEAMLKLDYPTDKLQILFLTEEDDETTRQAIRAAQLPPHFSVVTVPDGKPRTKPRACNYGLLQATGDYLVIFDAEDVPDPLQLKKAVLTFANHDASLACVQAKLNYYNTTQNLLTRWFTVEYSSWFDLMLPGMQQTNLPLPLGGTSNHFRVDLLRKAGAWDPFNVTEDCDLGLRLGNDRLKTVVLDSTTYEEANSQVKNWVRQRSRWIKGYLQTYLVYMRHPLRYLRRGGLREFLGLQLSVGGKTAVLFVNPLMWALLAVYFLLKPLVAGVYQVLFPAPILYMSALCLIFGNFLYLYSHLLGCLKRGQFSLIKWALTIPIYWAMMSVAAFKALYQVFLKPHYWEKTKHGLHLRKAASSGAGASSNGVAAAAADAHHVSTLQPHVTWPNGNGHVAADGIRAQDGASSIEDGSDGLRPERVDTPPVAAREEEAEVPPLIFPATPRLVPSLSGHDSSLSVARPIGSDHRVNSESTLRSDGLGSGVLRPARAPWWPWLGDRWLIATIVLATIASIVAWWVAYQNHAILLYEDAFSHMDIARRLFDSPTPGLAQLGGIWLPLPAIVMLPFIWNDSLWRTGLAGSLPGMASYFVAAVYLFLAARRLTHRSLVAFVGTLVFVLNPNVLYVQATPLSEMVCVATMTMTGYYFLAWVQEERSRYLVLAAGCAFLATLARYDGWVLPPALFVGILLVGWMRRREWSRIEGNLVVFSVLAGLGIVLWLLWCAVIFGDPLYFQRSQYSAGAQSAVIAAMGQAGPTKVTSHDAVQSLRYLAWLYMDTIGPVPVILALASAVLLYVRRRLTPETIAAAIFVVPLPFSLIAFYTGQVSAVVPEVAWVDDPIKLFNTRFGVEMAAPVGLLVALLVGQWSYRAARRHWLVIASCVLAGVIVLQSVQLAAGGIITVKEGQYGAACTPVHPINEYLAQHYDGGLVLENLFTSKIDGVEAGIDLKYIVSESSGPVWRAALSNPDATGVDWVIARPGYAIDAVANKLDVGSPEFLSRYTLVVTERNGLSLYHRNGLAPLPTRPLPPAFLSEHSMCIRTRTSL